jgi:hypothetical protein
MFATIQSRSFVFSSAVKNVNIRIYKIITLPVVLCRCKTLSLTLKEVYRLRVFENRVLTRYFDRKETK